MNGYQYYARYSADKNGFMAKWALQHLPSPIQGAIHELTGWWVEEVVREVWMDGEHTGTYIRYKWRNDRKGQSHG